MFQCIVDFVFDIVLVQKIGDGRHSQFKPMQAFKGRYITCDMESFKSRVYKHNFCALA